MRRQHGRGINHRIALHRRFLFERAVDPCCRESESWLGGVRAGQFHLPAGRIHNHVLPGPNLAAAGLDFLHFDNVGVRVELHVVETSNSGHDESQFDRKRAAQRPDLLGQAIAAIGRVDQWQQRIAELDLQVVHLERACDRFVRGIGFGGGFGFLCLDGGGEFCPLVGNEGEGACPSAECQKRNHGNARQKRHEQHHGL